MEPARDSLLYSSSHHRSSSEMHSESRKCLEMSEPDDRYSERDSAPVELEVRFLQINNPATVDIVESLYVGLPDPDPQLCVAPDSGQALLHSVMSKSQELHS
jgi:hypothetical protein